MQSAVKESESPDDLNSTVTDDLKFSPKLYKLASYKFNIGQIYEEEEKDNLILSIREDIIDNVMRKIDQIDLTTRTIAFVVDIGCDALWRMLNIEFIQHSGIQNFPYPAWQADTSIKPSPKDTLAARSIPFAPRTKKPKESTEHVPKIICECHLGIPCECILPYYKRNKAEMRLLDETLMINVDALTHENIGEAETEEEEELEEEETLHVSYKSESIAEDIVPIPSLGSESSSLGGNELQCVLSEGFSKLPDKKKQVSLPMLNVTHPTRGNIELTDIELPAIRAEITTECVTIIDDPNPKKKKKE